jgi:hypothetical protein
MQSAPFLRRVKKKSDVSEQSIGPIFKGQEVQEKSFLLGLLALEERTDEMSRNVDKQLPHDAA